MTPRQAARWFRQRAAILPVAVARAEGHSVADAARAARELSRGRYRAARLRRMGHPYAVRDPRPPQGAAVVNWQSGAFARAWRVGLPTLRRDGTSAFLVNAAPHAAYLLGAPRPRAAAIRRPTLEAAAALTARARRARLDRAIDRVFRAR